MLLSFILTCLIIEATPGPNMAYLAILSISDGRRSAFAAVAGVALGLLVIGIGAALGVAALISSSPLVYQVLRWCGVFYLLWLAWDGWNTEKETSPDKTESGANHAKFFWRGFVTNILNPKAAVFYIAILPSFIEGSSLVATQTLTLTAVYVFIATLVHTFIVVLAGTARSFLDSPRRVLIARRVLSLLLIGVALWFAVSTSGALK